MNDGERSGIVERYFDLQVSLIASGLFDVVSHLDFFERNPHLRGHATRAQYVRVADALEESRTVPEINAGRLLSDYGEAHPQEAFLDVLLERDVAFTAGTDAHSPDERRERVPALQSLFSDRGIEPIAVSE